MTISKKEFDEIRSIVKEGQDGTVKAVRDMFISVGIDIKNPIKVQAQMMFLEKVHSITEKIIAKAIIALVVVISLAAIGLAKFRG